MAMMMVTCGVVLIVSFRSFRQFDPHSLLQKLSDGALSVNDDVWSSEFFGCVNALVSACVSCLVW